MAYMNYVDENGEPCPFVECKNCHNDCDACCLLHGDEE